MAIVNVTGAGIAAIERILAKCPYCKKTGVIVANKDVIDDSLFTRADSTVRVRVFPGEVCEHEFDFTLDKRHNAYKR